MLGKFICLAIPYTNFKEKIRITKVYKDKKILILKDVIIITDKC